MKAITIWQPWASLIAIGAKGFETRGWFTGYRGPIAIHAAKKDVREIMRGLPSDVQREMFNCLYRHFGIGDGALKRMPTGAIIATARLVNVWYIGLGRDGPEGIRQEKDKGLCMKEPHLFPTAQERHFGDWTPGRYAWEFADVRPLLKPVPISGKQGLWDFYPR